MSRLVLETQRLLLRPLRQADAWFILRLFNEPSFLANIGDRGVRTPDQAARYIREGPGVSYERRGFGLLGVEVRSEGPTAAPTPGARPEVGVPVGICGLVRRDGLDLPDLGFAFLPEVCGRGYASEASQAVLEHCVRLKLSRVLAITSQHNRASMRVLEKNGFERQGLMTLPEGEEELVLFSVKLEAAEGLGSR